MPTRQALRITLGARIFTLLALDAPILWYRNEAGLIALAAAGVIWFAAVTAEQRLKARPIVPVAEAGMIGLVCGFCIVDSPAILVALAVPPFAAAVLNGLRMSLFALSAELIFVVVTGLVWEKHLSADQSFVIFTWCMAGLGLALVGSFVHSTSGDTTDELAPYLDAQRLIRQLLDLSDDLSSGLDVTSLAGAVISDIRDQLPTAGLTIYVPRAEVLVALISTADDSHEMAPAEALAVESWARSEPIVYESAFSFPLGSAAVIGGLLSPTAELPVEEIERTIVRLTEGLRSKAVQLDTALLFADFRELASVDVRTRLAREMHDGVAQDIAALGYLVDALAARPANDKQAAQFAMLRDRITKIVAEVRQSVLALRTSIGEAASLGAAISSVARHLSESSRVPIQVTLDEHSTRLRPEVEAELFRIAQEAMNNAIKHAQCASIEVNCQVYAPDALITIADDGRGMQQARSDSHGLKIMRERARLVGAALTIESNPGGGLVVSVRLGGSTADVQHQPNAESVSP